MNAGYGLKCLLRVAMRILAIYWLNLQGMLIYTENFRCVHYPSSYRHFITKLMKATV